MNTQELKTIKLLNLHSIVRLKSRTSKWQSVFVSRTDRMKGRKIKSKK